MITTFTGVSQARRRGRGSAEPSWDPSAEVRASVPLTTGLSLNLFGNGLCGPPRRAPLIPALAGLAGESAMPAQGGSYRSGRANRPGVNQSSVLSTAEITLTPACPPVRYRVSGIAYAIFRLGAWSRQRGRGWPGSGTGRGWAQRANEDLSWHCSATFRRCLGEIKSDDARRRRRPGRRGNRRRANPYRRGIAAGAARLAGGRARPARPGAPPLDIRCRARRGGAAAPGRDHRLPAGRSVPPRHVRLSVGCGTPIPERGEPERLLRFPVAAAAVSLAGARGRPAAPH